MIDTHCHLHTYYQNGTLANIQKQARDSAVNQMICIGTKLEDWSINQKIAKNEKDIFYTVGLHPCYVDSYWESTIEALSTFFISDPLPVAVGEIGLDYFHLSSDTQKASEQKSRQEQAFIRQLEIADQLDCPIVIHSRDCFPETIQILDDCGIEGRKILMHCYSYGINEIQELQKRGVRASFTGMITYKNAETIRAAALHQGLDRLILETDCPYLSPLPHRGKANVPAYLHHTASFCADLFGVSLQEIDRITTQNTHDFFHLPS